MHMCYVLMYFYRVSQVISLLDLMERSDTSNLSKLQSSPNSFFNLEPNRQCEVPRKNLISAPSREACITNWRGGLFEG